MDEVINKVCLVLEILKKEWAGLWLNNTCELEIEECIKLYCWL